MSKKKIKEYIKHIKITKKDLFSLKNTNYFIITYTVKYIL